MNKQKKATLFILSGLPAAGKSTLSKYVVKEFAAIYLRIDTIEQGLRDLCKIKVEGQGYGLAYRIAEDNLKMNLNVVADSCNPIDLTRKEWEKVAKLNNCEFLNIEIICSDKAEHKRRAESRSTEIENLKLPDWNKIENREYHNWKTDRITIDTANKTIKESAVELIKKINEQIPKGNPAHNNSYK